MTAALPEFKPGDVVENVASGKRGMVLTKQQYNAGSRAVLLAAVIWDPRGNPFEVPLQMPQIGMAVLADVVERCPRAHLRLLGTVAPEVLWEVLLKHKAVVTQI